MTKLVITIDGPAGSGKSTVARLLAEKIGANFLDTAAMYRAVTAAAMEERIDLSDSSQLLEVLGKNKFDFENINGIMTAAVNGVDFTQKIRKPEVTINVRYAAGNAEIRTRLVEMQREFAAKYEKIVTEGRDQGTVVFPDADFKFFLTASVPERARRRYEELVAKGEKVELARIQKEIEQRDKSDIDRLVGPLKPAKDAIVIDTTKLTVDEIIQKMVSDIRDAGK